MSQTKQKRYIFIKKELSRLRDLRTRHLDACHLITKKENELCSEVDQIEPEVLAYMDVELRRLGVRPANPSKQIRAVTGSGQAPLLDATNSQEI